MGGKCSGTASHLKVVENTAYYSLPLGLTLGITGSLFLLPFIKHAAPALRDRVIPEFLTGPALGGIMITEPTGGTDVINLQTTLAEHEGGMLLNGAKCWGGLTGKAQHWLVAGRKMRGARVTRSLKLIYVSLSSPGVEVDTYFDALGLNPIPYGRTHYTDVHVPREHDLTPKGKSALRIMYDTLFRCRMGMPAIAAGLCRRLLDEATDRTGTRIVFGKPIADFDQVRYRLETLRGFAQINACLWRFTADWLDGHEDVAGDYLLANAVKVISSETMTAASDSVVQLFASAAYKRDHLAGRAYVDSRPFRIFEGSNDVLHENSFEVVAGRHGAVTPETVDRELSTFGLRMPDNLPPGTLTALNVGEKLPQRQTVHRGKIIEWIVALGILDQIAPQVPMPGDEGRRTGRRHIAALLAELPYLG